MGKEHIEKYQFKKGESGNPQGRPKKLVSSIIKDLKAQGYERVSASEVTEVMEYLLNVPKNDLIDLWDGKDVPIILSTISKQLSRGDEAWSTIKDMLDRAQGKPTNKQELDVNLKGKVEGFKGFDLGDE